VTDTERVVTAVAVLLVRLMVATDHDPLLWATMVLLCAMCGGRAVGTNAVALFDHRTITAVIVTADTAHLLIGHHNSIAKEVYCASYRATLRGWSNWRASSKLP
jgi:hypothetical protein